MDTTIMTQSVNGLNNPSLAKKIIPFTVIVK